jgi:NAD(P)-dependent dehydrogenase (short-subunit alcohol dehydrogenase family)
MSRQAEPGGSEPVTRHFIDLTDEESIDQAVAAATSAEPLDLVIVATGILHRRDGLRPEKSMGDLQPAAMADVFAINTIGPALVAKYCLPRMRRGHKTVFAAISARVGSISDNRLGGWMSYRASKAALNMIMKSLAVEQARRSPDSVVVTLHPGTVATRLSRPYSQNVPGQQLFTADQSANYLLNVIDALHTRDSGGFFAWDGSGIEF